MYTFLVPEDSEGIRLDKFLHEALGDTFSRTFLQKSIKEGNVTIQKLSGNALAKDLEKKVIKKVAHILEKNTNIEVVAEKVVEDFSVEAENIPLEILYEDDDVLIISKPTGMCVHPDHAHTSGTVVNAVLGYLSQKNLSSLGGLERPGIVHRLDKDTSGCLMIAKHDKAHRYLSDQIAKRKVDKHYSAVVLGRVKAEKGTIDSPIGRDQYDRKKQSISTAAGSREALSHFTLKAYFQNPTSSLLDVEIITGRTHQIRVHLESIGHPLLGDETYGNPAENEKFLKDFPIKRIALHARTLELVLPSGKNIKVEAPYPEDLQKTIDMLMIDAK